MSSQSAGFYDTRLPPGTNFAVGAFRWWHPADTQTLRGVLVLVPGSQGDGRPETADPFWQEFARRHELGLVACCFRDHPHENMGLEEYVRAGEGTGQALLDAISTLTLEAGHPEAATAPLLLWGLSAGGQFNYEFTCWKPERVLAFAVNKGGIYYTHLAPAAARAVPGIFFIGGKDEEFRIHSIRGIFAVNKAAGAVWRLVVNADEHHETGMTRNQSVEFFEEILTRRP